jgi:hypothetical protein
VTEELERRYARLLRLYPAAYRRARGAEMLAVLMDTAPRGRRRPEWRERRALVLGALRVRAGAHGRRTAAQSWRVSLRTAALMLLIETAGQVIPRISEDMRTTSVIVAVACGLAVVAVLRGWYLVAATVTATAFVLDEAARMTAFHGSSPWPLPLVVVLLIPLIGRGRVVVPRALNYLLLVPVISVVLDTYGTQMRDPAFQTAGRAVWQLLAVAAVLWAVVDERVTLTFGLAFCYVVVSRAEFQPEAFSDTSQLLWMLADMGILAILPVLDIVVGAAAARRRARI